MKRPINIEAITITTTCSTFEHIFRLHPEVAHTIMLDITPKIAELAVNIQYYEYLYIRRGILGVCRPINYRHIESHDGHLIIRLHPAQPLPCNLQ